MKGNRTTVAQQVADFFSSHPRTEHSVKRVAEDIGASPNTVGQHVLNLFDAGFLLRRMDGIARGRKYLYVLNPKQALRVGQQVWYDDNSGKVEAVHDAGTRVDVEWANGNRTTVDRSDLLTHAEYVAMQPLPHSKYDMTEAQVVQWANLPTWVKGGADRGDQALEYAKASTWLEVGPEVFYQFSGDTGTYVGVWARE